MTLELYVYIFLVGSAVTCGIVMSYPPRAQRKPTKGGKL
mgnify:CR=1 FL=1|jgi:hypothetical protein